MCEKTVRKNASGKIVKQKEEIVSTEKMLYW